MPDDLEKSLQTVAKGGGILFFGTILSILLAMINSILLARVLGVKSYGLFYLAFSIVSVFIPFSTFGLPGGLPRFLPFHYGRDEKSIVRSAIRYSQVFVLSLGILFSIIVFFFSEKISIDIFHDSNLTSALKYFAIGIPLLSLSNILESVLRAFKAVKYKVVVYDLGIWTIRLIIFIPFILVGYAFFGSIISYLIAIFFTICISIFLIKKKIFSDQMKYSILPISKKLLSFSWPLGVTSIVSLFYLKTDVILLGYYLSSQDVGLYTPSLTIAQYMTLFAAPIGYIFLPVVSELFGKEKLNTVELLFKSASKWIIIMIIPIFIFILLFPKEILTIFYGSEYSAGYLSLVILAIGMSMTVFTGMTGGILVGAGYTRLNLATVVIASIFNISLNLVLIPLYGIIGAAIGTSISYFAYNLSSLAFVYKTTKMHAFNKKYIGIVFSGLIVFIVFYLLKTLIFPSFSSLLFVLIAGLLLLGLYTILIFVFRCLDKNDAIILKIIMKRFGINFKMFKFLDDIK